MYLHKLWDLCQLVVKKKMYLSRRKNVREGFLKKGYVYFRTCGHCRLASPTVISHFDTHTVGTRIRYTEGGYIVYVILHIRNTGL